MYLSRICCPGGEVGKILPFAVENDMDPESRFIIYLLVIFWLFLGVTAAADTFMTGVECITSTPREITVIEDGEEKKIEVQVWNDTVANLTLMALGSSAPEILLSIVEIFSNRFYSGVLGPSTIVGSASFNLFLITAICISALPPGEVRYIKDLNVFFITAMFSIFAYAWIVVIVALISPDRIERWEAVVTFCFSFPLIILAYFADIGKIDFGFNRITNSIAPEYEVSALDRMELANQKWDEMRYEMRRKTEENGMANMNPEEFNAISNAKLDPACAEDAIMKLVHRKYRENPEICENDFVTEITSQVKMSLPQKKLTRAFYRLQACRRLMATKSDDSQQLGLLLNQAFKCVRAGVQDTVATATFEFKQANYSCMENGGPITLTVVRTMEFDFAVRIPYYTVDDDAKAGIKYETTKGILNFDSGIKELPLIVPIIDNDIHEPDQSFFVHLENPVFVDKEHSGKSDIRLGQNKCAKVLIIDDDVPGVLAFGAQELLMDGDNRILKLKIKRKICGAIVGCSYYTIPQTAKPDHDYIPCQGDLEMLKGEGERIIEIPIIDSKKRKASSTFQVVLHSPTGDVTFLSHKGTICDTQIEAIAYIYPRPRTDLLSSLTTKIFTGLGNALGEGEGMKTWWAQFTEAIWVNGSREAQAEANFTDWIFHILTFVFKILVAFCPPPNMGGGYLTFFSSLILIAGFTALINDMGNLVGCTINMSDHITAITIVAIGTSVPDTTASRLAAISDAYADNSVGNITGSNSVNVFLGLGISWTIGAFYWHGKSDDVEWRQRYEMEVSSETLDAGGFIVPRGALVANVIVFIAGAIFTLALLWYRRRKVGGELGGLKATAHRHSFSLTVTWMIYIAVASYFAAAEDLKRKDRYLLWSPT